MIVVDSTVWVDHFNGVDNGPRNRLLALLKGGADILVGDLVLQEVLQGFNSDRAHREALEALRPLPWISMLGPERAVVAAQNYRDLRRRGVTVRKATDVAIATFCILEGHALLHNDRDFDPFEKHLGLKVIR